MWINTITQGRVAESLDWARAPAGRRHETEDIDLRILGHAAAMDSHFYLGELLVAQAHGDKVLALYDPQRAERWMQQVTTKSQYGGRDLVCHWTWMLGYPDQAVRSAMTRMTMRAGWGIPSIWACPQSGRLWLRLSVRAGAGA